MELDLVDPRPEAVVRAQARRILVREAAPIERLAREERAERRRAICSPAGAFPVERFDKSRVLEEEVVVDERGRLVRKVVYWRSLRARLGATRGGSSGCFG
jgi:hypothetical protein